MKLTQLLDENKDKVTISFEFIPPKKGFSRSELINKIAPLMEFNPLFVDVTTHRDDYQIETTPEGIQGHSYQKFPSTLVVCESIRNAFPNIEVIPHVLAGGYTKAETEDLLIDLDYLGYDNVVALRGDKLLYEKTFTPHPQGNTNTVELLNQIRDLNLGISLSPAKVKTDFCVACAAYPEKHYSMPNQTRCDDYTKNKIRSGAQVLITQMCFDPKRLVQYIEGFPDYISPHRIIPGIKLLTSVKQLTSIPTSFNVNIPEELVKMVLDSRQASEEYTVNMCKQLIKNGIKHLHFYTMNSDSIIPVLKQIL